LDLLIKMMGPANMPNTITDKARRLAAYKAKVAALQEQVENDRAKALAHLHEEYGFESPRELIKAIRVAAGSRCGHPAGKQAAHRKHARITPELREKIKAALKAGKTGGKVAAEFGVSLPSVYNIKKASGLVKARKAAKAKKPAKPKKAKRVKKPAQAEKPAAAASPAPTK
jgi:hypothetical protein